MEPTSGVMVTVMAARELLMEYFKSSCVKRLVRHGNVKLRAMNTGGGYLFERQASERESLRVIYIGDVPIMTLRRTPESVVFHLENLNRSKQLRDVYALLDEFMRQFLQGIPRSVTGEETPKGRKSDAALVSRAAAVTDNEDAFGYEFVRMSDTVFGSRIEMNHEWMSTTMGSRPF